MKRKGLLILLGVILLGCGCAGEDLPSVSIKTYEALQGECLAKELRLQAERIRLEKVLGTAIYDLKHKRLECDGLRDSLEATQAENIKLRARYYPPVGSSNCYTIGVMCDNCHKGPVKLAIPKGITVRAYASEVICPYCGCMLED